MLHIIAHVAENAGEKRRIYKELTSLFSVWNSAGLIDSDNYSNYTFSMHGGDGKYVTLVFINHIKDSIID